MKAIARSEATIAAVHCHRCRTFGVRAELVLWHLCADPDAVCVRCGARRMVLVEAKDARGTLSVRQPCSCSTKSDGGKR